MRILSVGNLQVWQHAGQLHGNIWQRAGQLHENIWQCAGQLHENIQQRAGQLHDKIWQHAWQHTTTAGQLLISDSCQISRITTKYWNVSTLIYACIYKIWLIHILEQAAMQQVTWSSCTFASDWKHFCLTMVLCSQARNASEKFSESSKCYLNLHLRL